MKKDTEAQIAEIEQNLCESLEIRSVSELANFPFNSLQEIRQARDLGHLTFGTPQYLPDLLDIFGTRTDVVMKYVWGWLPYLVIIGFIVVSFVKSNFLFGILSTGLGIVLSSPYIKGCAYSLIGVAWIGCIYFAFANPVWAWVIGGFYAGYMFTATLREQFRMLMEERALQSEIIFCYLYLSKILCVRDNRTGALI